MLAAVEQALANVPEDPLATWPYDGVAGTLPDWLLGIPHEGRDFLHHRMRVVRALLDRAARQTEDDRADDEALAGAAAEELRAAVSAAVELLDELDEVVAGGDIKVSVTQRRSPVTGEPVAVPIVEHRRRNWELKAGGLRESLAHLARLRRCIKAGDAECLKRRAGGDAVSGYKSRHAVSKPRGEPWYAPYLREYVRDMARAFGKRRYTLAEWLKVAQARSDSDEFWTRRGVEVYMSEGDDGEPVIVVSKSGEHRETAATKTLKPKVLYRYFPR